MNGKSNNIKRRVKPAIADRNADAALRNLMTKVSLLRTVLELDGPIAGVDRASLLYHLPRTMRQFNLWHSELLPPELVNLMPGFRSNTQRTLNKNAEQLELLVEALKVLDALSVQTRPKKLQTIASSKQEAREAQILKRIAIRELDAEREISIVLLGRLEALNARYDTLQKEAASALEGLLEENLEMRGKLGIDISFPSSKAKILLLDLTKRKKS